MILLAGQDSTGFQLSLTSALNGARKRAKPRLRASVFERVVSRHCLLATMLR